MLQCFCSHITAFLHLSHLCHGIDLEACLHRGDVTHSRNTLPSLQSPSLSTAWNGSSRHQMRPITSCVEDANLNQYTCVCCLCVLVKSTSVSSWGKCQGHSSPKSLYVLWFMSIALMSLDLSAHPRALCWWTLLMSYKFTTNTNLFEHLHLVYNH